MASRTPAQIAYAARKKSERLCLPPILCGCGCGTVIPPITSQGKPAVYAHGHNPDGEATRFNAGQEAWNKGQPAPWATAAHLGKPKSPESIASRTRTRRGAYGGSYAEAGRDPTSRRDRVAWRAAVTDGNRRRAPAMHGAGNPFFGHTHTAETRGVISARLSGEGNPGWQGGISMLPYGPEFTRRFKKLIRERDGNRCRRCGKTRDEVGRTLHVHHIDHDKMNNDPTNLVTACGSCNVWLSYHRHEPFEPLPI